MIHQLIERKKENTCSILLLCCCWLCFQSGCGNSQSLGFNITSSAWLNRVHVTNHSWMWVNRLTSKCFFGTTNDCIKLGSYSWCLKCIVRFFFFFQLDFFTVTTSDLYFEIQMIIPDRWSAALIHYWPGPLFLSKSWINCFETWALSRINLLTYVT